MASLKSRRDLAKLVKRHERDGLTLAQSLRAVMTDTGSTVGFYARGDAAKLLAMAEDDGAVRVLLEQFFKQADENELWETALAIETLGDRRAVNPAYRSLA